MHLVAMLLAVSSVLPLFLRLFVFMPLVDLRFVSNSLIYSKLYFRCLFIVFTTFDNIGSNATCHSGIFEFSFSFS